ncbi:efflux RND transporter periplasmic adaptor subunit [Actinoplanes sp. TFC3]|uniref:efflux RND transporter periplasmic adaptor subunit n=1 Tax=Actinoplanes sp. TFC3 TaxID=1710355 RepID=UPI0008337758|nr:HlyD family efflux transporter periplasmic adaptor subunit [Actinoplanes sp. TFC3]
MGIGSTGMNRRWAWVAAGIVVILALAAGVARALTAGAGDKPQAQPVSVAVDKGAVTTEVATTGTLQPAQTRTLSFAVAGTVESVKVRAGSTVGAGDTLATVDDTDARAAVGSARDALTEAEDALTSAQDAAATPATGCVAPAAYADPAPAASATGSPRPTRTVTPVPTKTSATAAPEPSRTTAPSPTPTRTSTGGQNGTPGGSQTGSSGGGQNGSQGGQNGAQNGGGQGQSGQSGDSAGGTCSQSSGAGNGADGSGGARSGGGDAVLSAQQRVNQAQVALENAEDNLDGATITAPIRGRVLSVAGQVGSQVGAGSTFISLADVYDMQVSADFPEADAGALAARQKATIALANRTGDDLGATVVQVDPVGTSDGTMVRYGVLLSFDDPPTDLLVGQSAAVRVTTGSAQDVLRVPSTAVHDVAGTSGTVLKDGAQLTVTIGLRGDQYTGIAAGLVQGDVVARSW